MSRRVHKGGTDTAAIRARLRERCRAQLELERGKRRAQAVANARAPSSTWWADAVHAEAHQSPALSEEVIGQILREEYERTREMYEKDGAEALGEPDIDQMLLLEEEIRNERDTNPPRPRPAASQEAHAMDMDM